MRVQRNLSKAGAVAAISLLALTGCGGGDGAASTEPEDTGDAREANADIAAMVPESISADGKLVIGVDPSIAPMVYEDPATKEITGFEGELAREIAAVLGLEPEFAKSPFTGLIAGLDAKRYETVMSFVVDTKERQETVDFVDYFKVGAGILVPKGNPDGIEQPLDLCGVKTVVGSNSAGERAADAISEDCTAEGKPAIDKLVVQAPTDIPQALTTGRADAALNASVLVAYSQAQAPESFDVAGEFFGEVPGGALFHKDDAELRDAVAQAVVELQEDGTYDALLEEYGLEFASLEGAPVNAAEG